MSDIVYMPVDVAPAQMRPTEVTIHEADGIFIKRTVLPVAGTRIPQHAHDYAHISLLAAGGARVMVNDEVIGEYTAPAGILIKAGVEHLFETTEPNTIIDCIHNLDRLEAKGAL